MQIKKETTKMKSFLMILLLLIVPTSAMAQQYQPSYIQTLYAGTPVTTGAWVTISASLPNGASSVNIFDSSGQTMLLGRFLTGCVTLISSIIIPPGGQGQAPYPLVAGDCIRLRALSALANAGENDINFFP